VSSYCKSL